MKLKVASALVATLVAVSPLAVFAQNDSLSSADRAMLQEELKASLDGFLSSVEGLSEAQWRYKPAANRWSIAEVAEHIAATDELIGNMVTTSLPPIAPLPPDSAARTDERVRLAMRDRSKRFDAPPVIQPAGKYATRTDLLQALTEIRNKLNRYLETTRDPLRNRGLPHPALGPLDGVQWVVLLAGHEVRHTQQIEEVKRSEGYPRP